MEGRKEGSKEGRSYGSLEQLERSFVARNLPVLGSEHTILLLVLSFCQYYSIEVL